MRSALYIRMFLTAALLWSGSFSCLARKAVDIKPFLDGFVMAGSDGSVYWTDMDGQATDSVRLKCDIAGIDVRDGYVLAVSSDCAVMRVERDGKSSRLCRKQIDGSADRVVGIACCADKTLILTENGMILSTVDFNTFSSMSFNGKYSLYYEQTWFSSIGASDNSIFIAGTLNDGRPAVYTSTAGNIWSQRTLNYRANGMDQILEQQPLHVAYDAGMDRFVLGCTDGYLFYLPGCSHCNQIEKKADSDIHAVAFNSGVCLVR